jgi:hypothetical protein
MQAQMAPGGSDRATPKLTKQKTKEIFLYTEERKMESMKKLMSNPGRYQSDPMEGMLDMMIEQAKLSDELFDTYHTEEEEFNAAVLHFDLMNDPEVTRIINDNMRKLGLGGQGGMGGMMGGMQ